MKSLHTYINEKLIINQKQKITPRNREELDAVILDHFKSHNGDLNDINVSKLNEEDFYSLFYNLRDEIEKNNITEIDISDWDLKNLYFNKSNYMGMFSNCDTLENVILPNCLEVIDHFAFYYCKKLKNIIIPNSVSFIGVETFLGCRDLTNINVPNSITYIGVRAFCNCNKLKNVTISNSITYIGGRAFYGCNNLTITVSNMRVKKLIVDSMFNGEIEIKQ